MSDVRGIKLIRALVGRKQRQELDQYLAVWDQDPQPAALNDDGVPRLASELSLRQASMHWFDHTDTFWRQTALEVTHRFVQRRATTATILWSIGSVALLGASYFVWWAWFQQDESAIRSLSAVTLAITSLIFSSGTMLFKPAVDSATLQSQRLATWRRDGSARS